MSTSEGVYAGVSLATLLLLLTDGSSAGRRFAVGIVPFLHRPANPTQDQRVTLSRQICVAQQQRSLLVTVIVTWHRASLGTLLSCKRGSWSMETNTPHAAHPGQLGVQAALSSKQPGQDFPTCFCNSQEESLHHQSSPVLDGCCSSGNYAPCDRHPSIPPSCTQPHRGTC